MNIEIRDLRSGERFTVSEPLLGTFGAAEVTILNVAEQGVQITHRQPIRLATKARLWFKRGDAAANVHGLVVWSHLSKTADESGAYRYLSGVRIESDPNAFAAVMQSLADQGVLRRDLDSLERKRQRVTDRERERSAKPVVKLLHHELDVPSDQALLIQHARERLRLNPDEAQKWYNRAKYALADDGTPIPEQIRNREDVLAVWEYLERTVPLSTIVRVFSQGK